MAQRIKVGVIFGGRSGEHEVSLASAYSVMTHLDPERYEVIPVGISKSGEWLIGGAAWPTLRAQAKIELGAGEGVPVTPLPDAQAAALSKVADGVLHTQPVAALSQLDVIFPVLHGPFGEDGTMQGLLELAGLPYVGPGVAASAIAMDKVQTKRVLAAAGIPQCAYQEVRRVDLERDQQAVCGQVAQLGFPVFVKPANMGSSVGITKAHNVDELAAALNEAARFDRRVVVEAAVPNAREIEIAVLGNDDPMVSVPGEVVPSAEFYSYEAKYLSGSSELRIPAPLPEEVTARIGQLALTAFRTLDLAGMSRVDFLVPQGTDEVYLNEINTIPGFTEISMYPKMWAASGLPYERLLSRLIDLAIERFEDKRRSATSI